MTYRDALVGGQGRSQGDRDRVRPASTRVHRGLTMLFMIALHMDRATEGLTDSGDGAAVAAGR
jgi:hypothetical protein